MDRLQNKVMKLEKNYKYSARRYSFLNKLITIPSILITSMSSIFSFLSTSNMVPGDFQNRFIIVVAILTSLATMLQTINSSCEFSVKKTKFKEASLNFNLLSDKIFFEIEHSNEKDFIDKIEEEIANIKNQCKFIPLEMKERNEKNDYLQLA